VATFVVDRMSIRHMAAERSWKDADFLCFMYLALRLGKKCCHACGDMNYYFRCDSLVSAESSV
jgi:hypothetical protein